MIKIVGCLLRLASYPDAQFILLSYLCIIDVVHPFAFCCLFCLPVIYMVSHCVVSSTKSWACSQSIAMIKIVGCLLQLASYPDAQFIWSPIPDLACRTYPIPISFFLQYFLLFGFVYPLEILYVRETLRESKTSPWERKPNPSSGWTLTAYMEENKSCFFFFAKGGSICLRKMYSPWPVCI